MPRYPHVIFDLDHTLWDFERNSKAALGELYAEMELGSATDTAFDHFFKRYQRHNNNCWQLYRKGNMDKETLRVERFRRAFVDIGEQRMELIPQLAGSLRSARRTGSRSTSGASWRSSTRPAR